MNLKNHITVALGYFLVIAILGLVLRLFFVVDIDLNYRHIVHTHSHIALLGWVYTALSTLIYYCFIDQKNISKKYRRLFWCTQLTFIGMLISFPLTGYALFSIIFSTLFLLVSYWFFGFIIKHTKQKLKNGNSYKLIKVSFWFMMFSSIGPWVLGAIMNTLGNTSIWYKNAIYFYLHFQYNGWFIVALIGLFFYQLEKQQIEISKKEFKRFYWLLISSVLLTFCISVLWTKPPIIFNLLGGLGSILQFFAFGYLFKILKPQIKNLSLRTPLTKLVFTTVIVLFALKMLMQLMGAIPYFAHLISVQIDFAIGYLHWTFLGVVSIAILGFLHQFRLITLSKRSFQLYFIGFVLTEVLIFYKGITQWLQNALVTNYYWYLAIASIVITLGILMIFLKQLRVQKSNSN